MMSTHVKGFRPPDQKFKDLKSAWDACKRANIGIPKEIGQFFDWEEPDVRGVEVKIPTQEWKDDYGEGYEIEVAKIPKDVKFIRFYNTW